LFNAALSQLQQATALQHMAVQRAQRAVREAEDKLDTVRKWERALEDRTAPLVKQIEEFHGFLITEMGKAIAQLVQIVQTLDTYTKVGKPSPEGAQP
jgi:GTP1/Obg family GTP-binding protein